MTRICQNVPAMTTSARIVSTVLLATMVVAGTIAQRATIKLIDELGGDIVGVSVLAELAFLEGRARLAPHEIQSLIVY